MVTNSLTEEEKQIIIDKSKKADRIVLGTMVVKEDDDIISLVKELSKEKTVDLISMKSPYVGKFVDKSNFWINTYEPSRTPIDIAVRTLLGEIKPTGVSPVTI